MSRKYSLDEIDRMRRALKTIATPEGSTFYAHEVNANVEDQLRTYMLNGTAPEDLEAKASASWGRPWTRVTTTSVP